MDSRFTDESIAFSQLATSIFSLWDGFSLEEARRLDEELHMKSNETLLGISKGTLEKKRVKLNSVDIPITIYTPIDVNKNKLVIYYHGGGWTTCNVKTHQTIVNMLADATKTIWISVEYRVAPEHKFPIWLDDACSVAQHIIENKLLYGINQTAKIGVAGDSAGGQISASVCHTVKNIDFQILVYGFLDVSYQAPSYKEFADPMYLISPETLNWFVSNAIRDEADIKNPRMSVLLNTSFDALPPCLFIVAELDPLRDDSYAYQELLNKAGVKTKLVLIKGVLHSFFVVPGIYPKACAQAIDAIQEFMASI